jgi:UDP-N-acetylglucosamine--N-acetylmuramyl-(pentapeptide) pyrophosphoryl-undecaprenol N-acetylglucosamine transferase
MLLLSVRLLDDGAAAFSTVMPGLVPSIHVLASRKAWMAGTSPAMTDKMRQADSMARSNPLILLCAGGTGGHLFPAQAAAIALKQRGARIALATDERVERYSGDFPADSVYVIPSATLRGRSPLAYARTATTLGLGLAKAWALLGKLRPAAVVGFGGYPTVPPLKAAMLRRIPTVLHEQNSVMGRANRMLAPRVTAIGSSFRDIALLDPSLKSKVTLVGTPVRPNVIEAAASLYAPPRANETLRLVIFGGSQGAKVFADIMPEAIAALELALRNRLSIVQQVRGEDRGRVRTAYDQTSVKTEVADFFTDLPLRIAQSHLVVSRSGASTVAEVAAIGRPAIFVPLPNALDHDQLNNARVVERASGAIVIEQPDFTPQRVAAELTALLADSERLAGMAAGARSIGVLDGGDRLAELVMKVAG